MRILPTWMLFKACNNNVPFQIRQIEVRVSLLVFVRCFCFVYISLFAVCSSFGEEVIRNLSVGNWLRDWQDRLVGVCEVGLESVIYVAGNGTNFCG